MDRKQLEQKQQAIIRVRSALCDGTVERSPLTEAMNDLAGVAIF